MPRKRHGEGKAHVCTYCKRVHPKGAKQKARAKAAGWESCKSVAMRRAQAGGE